MAIPCASRPRPSRWSISPLKSKKTTTTEELRQAFRDAAKEPRFKGILEAVDEPLVSMDFKGSSYSSSVDLPFTMRPRQGKEQLHQGRHLVRQ